MLKEIVNNTVNLMIKSAALKEELESEENSNRECLKNLLKEIIDVLDSFYHVFENIEPKMQKTNKQTKIWIGNFKTVRRILEDVIKNAGVTEMESIDLIAVPGYHTVIETTPKINYEDGYIIEVFKKGYLWNKEVLRKAEVKTVKNQI